MKNKLFYQDVQFHTNFSDGKNTISEMVDSIFVSGLKSCIVTDHAKGWKSNNANIEFFPNADKYRGYLKEIDEIKSIYTNSLKIYSGLEIEIDIYGNFQLDKGIIDYVEKEHNEKTLGVDIILGSIHSESIEEDYKKFGVKSENKRRKLLENMINLIKNPHINVFAHPFQAIHGQFSDNFDKEETHLILDTFKTEWGRGHKIFFEINGNKYPQYEQWTHNKYKTGELNTNDITFLKEYKLIGGKFVLGSDAHSTEDIIDTNFSVIDDLELKESDIFIF